MRGRRRSPGGPVVATIAAKNYLPQVRVLARTLTEHHPELPLVLLLADEADGDFDPAAEPFEVLPLSQLPLPEPRALLFRHDRLEVCCVTKPYLLGHLLDRGFGAVLYIDADVMVTGDLSALLAEAGGHPVCLTPHHLSPVPGPDGAEVELMMLRAGAFNAGVVGVSGAAGRRFVDWWAGRIYASGRSGVFHDQHWLDLAPTLFEGVRIVRDPGVNVAYWNLAERGLRVEDGRPRVGALPCRLMHFSGWSRADPGAVSRHSPLRLEDIGSASEVFERYAALVAEAGKDAAGGWPYAYGRFADGSPIPLIARRIYGRRDDVERFGDPFSSGPGSFVEWLNAPSDGQEPAISRFWRGVHAHRPDLKRAFADLSGADRLRYLVWTQAAGRREHGVPEILW